ncbi:MAG TPA: hypothetical protein VF194_04955 [Ferrovibrio sp.]|uniref:hypothetical protein n=1 Tax=Ferrovibrio sp. TaxID=1917215 RepID=UPI002ED0BF10
MRVYRISLALAAVAAIVAVMLALILRGGLDDVTAAALLVGGYSLMAVVIYAAVAPSAYLAYMTVGFSLGYIGAGLGAALYFAILVFSKLSQMPLRDIGISVGLAASSIVVFAASLFSIRRVVEVEDRTASAASRR